MEELLNELKHKILRILDLIEIRPEDVHEEDPLVGGNLGIDSIDLLEIVMMVDADYGVKIESRKVGEKVFRNLRTLTEHIYCHSPRFAG